MIDIEEIKIAKRYDVDHTHYISSSQDYIVPNNVTSITIKCYNSDKRYMLGFISDLTPGQIIPVIVGTTDNNIDTSFGIYYTAAEGIIDPDFTGVAGVIIFEKQ